MDFETELVERRAAIVAEIEGLRARASALERVLSSFEAVIGYYNPNAVPVCQKKVRPSSGAAIPAELQGINKTAAVFEILREADRPLSNAECVAALVARHGVAANHPGLRRFSSHISATLNGLLRRGRVRQARGSDGRTVVWAIAL